LSDTVLMVRDLEVSYIARDSRIKALRGVDLELERGKSLCIVGESGSGKTTLGLTISRNLPPNAYIEGGEVILDGIDVLREDPSSIRGKLVSLIPQEVGGALSPFNRIEDVFRDIYKSIGIYDRSIVIERALSMLSSLGFDDPVRILRSYPHELSGGMLQRILIALALSLSPKVVIADEPTSMIDASLRKSIVDLLNKVRETYSVSLIVITHDIAITPSLCSTTAVMYAGKIVENGPSKEVIREPKHPYTRMLIESIPSIRSAKIPKSIPGLPPDLSKPIVGCAFAPRCPLAMDICYREDPKVILEGKGRYIYCHLYRR